MTPSTIYLPAGDRIGSESCCVAHRGEVSDLAANSPSTSTRFGRMSSLSNAAAKGSAASELRRRCACVHHRTKLRRDVVHDDSDVSFFLSRLFH
jgi:hypothetical protein